jgi:hypothetical protein
MHLDWYLALNFKLLKKPSFLKMYFISMGSVLSKINKTNCPLTREEDY